MASAAAALAARAESPADEGGVAAAPVSDLDAALADLGAHSAFANISQARAVVEPIDQIMAGYHATGRWPAPKFNPSLVGASARAQCFYNTRRVRVTLAVCAACGDGRLDVAQWLTDRYNIVDVSAYKLLEGTCERGHLEVAQWAVGRFGLTVDDARCCRNWAIGFACANGHLAVARWLIDKFGLTAADAAENPIGDQGPSNFALERARAGGHDAVVQLLLERFGEAPPASAE